MGGKRQLSASSMLTDDSRSEDMGIISVVKTTDIREAVFQKYGWS